MILLKKISLNGDILSAVCYPEKSIKEKFEIHINIKSKEIIFLTDGASFTYAGHAKLALYELIDSGEPYPQEFSRYWY